MYSLASSCRDEVGSSFSFLEKTENEILRSPFILKSCGSMKNKYSREVKNPTRTPRIKPNSFLLMKRPSTSGISYMLAKVKVMAIIMRKTQRL